MNKKNFPIFISLFIVSLFFTVVFYYSYTIVKYNNEDVYKRQPLDQSMKKESGRQKAKKNM